MASKRKVTKKEVKKVSKKKVEFADGKDVSKEESIESLVGFKFKGSYGASTEREFEDKINLLSMSDLQALAVTNGVFPSGTKAMLKNKLKKAFAEYSAYDGRTPTPRETQPIIDSQSKEAKAFLDIMNGN
jgi:hypothetical protein